MQGNEDRDYAQQCTDATGFEHRFDGVGGKEDDIVGLKDRVGSLAVHDFFDVDLDQRPLVADGADDAKVAVVALEGRATGESGDLEEGEWRVLDQGDGALAFEGSEDVNDTDAGNDDGVAAEDRDVGEAAVSRIGTEIDDDRLVEPGTVDGDDVAGSRRQSAAGCEHVEQTALAYDGHDTVDFSDDGDRGARTLDQRNGDLGVAEHTGIDKLLGDKGFGGVNRDALERDDADQWELDFAVDADGHRSGVVAGPKDADSDDIASAENHIAAGRKKDGGVGGEGSGTIDSGGGRKGRAGELGCRREARKENRECGEKSQRADRFISEAHSRSPSVDLRDFGFQLEVSMPA